MAGNHMAPKQPIKDEELNQEIVAATVDTFKSYFNLTVAELSSSKTLNFAESSPTVAYVEMSRKGAEQGSKPEMMMAISMSIDVVDAILRTYFKDTPKNMPAYEVTGELANCIFSILKQKLRARGYDFESTLPQRGRGDSKYFRQLLNKPGLHIPFTSSAGAFYVSVTFAG